MHATGGHSGTIYMRLATSCMKILHGQVASLRAKPPVFASMLREQLLELKYKDVIEKSENLRDTCAS